jgi:hypothetical protein
VKWTVGFTLRPTKSTKYAWEWPDWVYLPSFFEMDINRRTYFSNRLLKLTNIEDTPILIISLDALANSALGYQTLDALANSAFGYQTLDALANFIYFSNS